MLRRALAMIEARFGASTMTSRFYRTPAFPAGSGPDFVNACAAVETRDGPEQVLAALHAIEAALGRERRSRWAARSIDLDLLAAGDMMLPDPATLRRWIDLPPEAQRRDAPEQLILPHPRLHERAFVLVPLAEIAADWRHPLLGASVAELLAALEPAPLAEIRPI